MEFAIVFIYILFRAASEAMEEIPEAFVQVQMLYFRTTLNGHDVTAFVDTGKFQNLLKDFLKFYWRSKK